MIEIGLVGTPNSGKSTFFKAATLKNIKIAAYPFTTLEPNEGLGYVTSECACKELGVQCSFCRKGIRFIPVKLWDVAGLVPDAHLGKGRGNAFLDDVMKSKLLIQVVDNSGKTDLEGNPADNFDPSLAVRMLETEINYWMLGILKKDLNLIKQGFDFLKVVSKRFTGLGISETEIKEAMKSVTPGTDEDSLLIFLDALRKQAKPIVVAANKADNGIVKRIGVETSAEFELALKEADAKRLIEYIPGSSVFEMNKEKLNEKQIEALGSIKKFLDEHGSTGVQNILNKAVFEILGMIVVYPVADAHKFTDTKGRILPDAYLLKQGSTAIELAFAIHEDIGSKFIAAVDARTGKNISAKQALKNKDVISIRAGR